MNLRHFIGRLLGAILLTVCFASPVKASLTFNYSYQFGNGLLVTGSLDGDVNGDFVENVSNVSVFFNGVQMGGTVIAGHFDGANWIQGAPVVSFDAFKNNFLFNNGSSINVGATEYFYMINPPVHSSEAVAYRFGSLIGVDIPQDDARWTLTAAAVPEPSTYLAGALMAGVSVVQFIRCRQKPNRDVS